MVGLKTELLEEDARHASIVMLTGVDNVDGQPGVFLCQPLELRHLDKVGAGSNDDQELHAQGGLEQK